MHNSETPVNDERRVSWRSLRPESLPPDRVHYVADAQLTPEAHGSFQISPGRAVTWHSGAAYDSSGLLVEHSRRSGGFGGDFLHSIDQAYAELPQDSINLKGSYYYGGLWMQHFGHFLLETLPMLWAHDGETPILFHRLGDVGLFKRELLELSGVSGGFDFVERPTRVDHLIVPSRPVALNRHVSPAAVRLWERVARKAAGDGVGERRVWLSRSRAEAEGAGVNRTLGYRELDEVFAGLGFEVVFPEELSVREQVTLARSSEILAGFEGSALHLSAFSREGTKVLALGSERRPAGNLAQPAIDRAKKLVVALVPFGPLDQMVSDIRSLVG